MDREVDFADMLDYKDSLMTGETPRCRRERLTADVTDAVQRRVIFAATGPAPALMITEGLLMIARRRAAKRSPQKPPSRAASRIDGRYHDDYLSRRRSPLFRNPFATSSRRFSKRRANRRRSPAPRLDDAARRSYITDMAFAMERIQRRRGDQPPPAGLPPVPPDDPTGVHVFFARLSH